MDWIGGVLYIGDKSLHKIVACSVATRHCTTVVRLEHTAYPASLAVDSLSGWVLVAKGGVNLAFGLCELYFLEIL